MGGITGILLAGGESSRMGIDKSKLEYHGKTFLDIAISNLSEVADQVLLISNHEAISGVEVYSDLVENIGPLGGLHTGLSYSNNPTNIVMACDMPLLNPFVLKEMILNTPKNSDGMVPYLQDKPQLLCAVFHKSIHPLLIKSIDSGTRKVMEFVEILEIYKWEVPVMHRHCFKNINTRMDYTDLISPKKESK